METGNFPTLRNLTRNHLLDSFPKAEIELMAPHIQLVAMPAGKVLCEPGEPLRYACFPTTAILSVHCVLRTGATVESATIGNDGVFGLPLFMGSRTSPNRTVVQSAGYGFQVEGQWLLQHFNPGTTIVHALLRYAQALLTQTVQSGACNRHHSIDQQLCRWLLSSLDRTTGNELEITLESVAAVFGARRDSVAEAVRELQHEGLIECGHDHITVIDRPGLETRACACYAVVKRAFDRLRLRERQADRAHA
jgi:CRP-like cAMP-binding protein